MLVNRNLENNHLMALSHYFAWQKIKKNNISPSNRSWPDLKHAQTQKYSSTECPGTLPPSMCPSWAPLICLLEFLSHLRVCVVGHDTWAISVHSVVQKTLPERDLPSNHTLFFLHIHYISGLQLWAIFSGVLHKVFLLPGFWVRLSRLLLFALHFQHKPILY